MLLAFLVAFIPAVQSQEYTKQIDDLSGYSTLVREYKSNKRIICNCRYDSTTFVMVTESDTLAQYLSVREDMPVSDMEVFGDTLYFCGSIYRGSLIGYVGFIDLSTFPASTVRIALMPELTGCYKLEAFRACYDHRIHVIATARDTEKRYCLVDCFKDNLLGWDYYKSSGEVLNRIYDDVAATDHQVIVTVRDNTDSTGHIYYFNHPTPGNHIFYGSFPQYQIYDHVISNILIESRTSDEYVTACKISPFMSHALNLFQVLYFNATTLQHQRFCLSGDNEFFAPNMIRDLKYNDADREIDMLVYSGYSGSKIYHLNLTNSITGHYYNMQDIHSLDYLRNDLVHFIASGYSDQGKLRFYKYSPQIWKDCAEKTATEFPISHLKLDDGQKGLSFARLEPFLSLVNQYSGRKNVKIICYHDENEDEE